jgi:hypothetical protein
MAISLSYRLASAPQARRWRDFVFARRPAQRDAILRVRNQAPNPVLSRCMNQQHTLIVASRSMSDDALVARLKCNADESRQKTVELLADLGELAARKLYRKEGPGRLFGYCTQVLRFSEAATYNRIRAAKAARKFPLILDLIADGSVNLTTIRLLAPHLTLDNHRELLAEATGRTRREVDKIVARLNPKPDVAATIRKLPSPGSVAEESRDLFSASAAAAATTVATPGSQTVTSSATSTASSPAPASHRPVIAPLSPERYRLQLTVGGEAHDDLRALQDLMRREIPSGDAAAIVERALKMLRKEIERRRFAATANPRVPQPATPGSRHIPAHVARAVWERDGGACAFIATNGRRCTERSYIEFHHAEPYIIGGEATVENIALRCHEHNAYESELVFGPYDPGQVRETSPVYA